MIRIKVRPYAAKIFQEIPPDMRNSVMSAQWLWENWQARVFTKLEYPYTEYLEFESEEAYILFLLRWT